MKRSVGSTGRLHGDEGVTEGEVRILMHHLSLVEAIIVVVVVERGVERVQMVDRQGVDLAEEECLTLLAGKEIGDSNRETLYSVIIDIIE